ncbi:MAG: WG repeat-containing protein [Cyanobacteriota bacterium]|nr:WG repeat-containing protein [Cyanobacteriota bacterium]
MVLSDIQNYWGKDAIYKLQNSKIIKGYPDGTFRPDAPVIRAEFAVLMCRAYPDAPRIKEPIAFTDVPDNYWAKEDIETASAKGFFAGYPDKTFRPEEQISRVQATIVLAASERAYIVPLNPEEILQQYFDDAADIPSYSKKMMAVAAINQIVVNYPDIRKFHPNRSATRGEVAALMVRSLGIADRVSSQYLATSNIFAIPLRFQSASSFSEGLAAAKKEGEKKSGFIDSTGEFVIAPNPDRTYHTPFSEGLAGVSINNKGGYIDKTGKIVIPPQIYGFTLRQFKEGLAAVQMQYEGKWGYLDKNGNLAIESKFSGAGDFIDGLALVTFENRFAYIDKSGEFAIEPKNYYATDFSEGRARIKIDQKWGYLDTNGDTRIQAQFREANDFSEGLAAVQADNYKWGYIDLDGNWIVEAKFSSAENFSEGLALVSVDGKSSYIDKTGKVVLEPEFDAFGSFSEGLAPVGIGGETTGEYEIEPIWGFIDKKGDLIIEPQFYSVTNFSEGFAAVRLRGNWERISVGYDGSAVPIDFRWVLRGGNYGYIYNPLL